jgi:colicin import membrane protein
MIAFAPSLSRAVAPLLLCLVASSAWPAGTNDARTPEPAASAAAATPAQRDAEERRQITEERAAAEAKFAGRERDCSQRFIVTSCLDEAKAERRQALDKLRERQIVLDEARRQERSETRQAELQEKAAEDARRESARAGHAAASSASASAHGRPLEAHPSASAAPGSAPHDRPHPSGIVGTPRPQESATLREQHEEASRAAYDARQAEAAEHRQQALQRSAERAAEKPPAAPLPIPAPASAASALARPSARP